jgi:hypothetical protein
VAFLASCGDGPESSSAGSGLDRAAWLGSTEGWGLLGLPLAGGPLTYLSAQNLESPTWAPPELGRIDEAWPGNRVIWLQFRDTRIGLYDYPTGHVLSFDSLKSATAFAAPMGREMTVAVARDDSTIGLAGRADGWRFALGGTVARLESARRGRILAVVDAEPESELVVLAPPESEPLARRQVGRVKDLAITPSGERLYYVREGDADLSVRGLSLPELGDAEKYLLPEAAQAVALTPSGHRLYVAAGRSLYVFDRLREIPVGEILLPGSASALRFGVNGANLLARLDGENRVAVLQVGVDSVLGVVSCDWDRRLPVALPGGRIVARSDTSLVLYDIARLVEVARSETEDGILWLAVDWQPPRPRVELASRGRPTAAPVVAAGGPSAGTGDAAPKGFYAVVLAARQRAGVDELVTWLRSVGYSGLVDFHRDAMGVEWFRAMVGPYPNREQAEAASQSLAARYGYKPWILSVEQQERQGGAEASPADTVAEAASSPVDSGRS